jgi:hypothetical protein
MRQGRLDGVSTMVAPANFARNRPCRPRRCDKMRQNATFTKKMETYLLSLLGFLRFFAIPCRKMGFRRARRGG